MPYSSTGTQFFLFVSKVKDKYDNIFSTYRGPRMLLHEFKHLLTHSNRFLVHVTSIDSVTLPVCMLNYCFYFILEQGVHDVPKVLLIALPALVDLWRHIKFDLCSISELVVHCLYRDFWKAPDIDLFHRRLR